MITAQEFVECYSYIQRFHKGLAQGHLKPKYIGEMLLRMASGIRHLKRNRDLEVRYLHMYVHTCRKLPERK